MIGRLIHGFCGGVLNICFQKAMIDTIPTEVTQQYGVFVNMGFNIGIFFINFIQSLICPFVDDGVQKLKDDKNWMIILGCSWILQILCLRLARFKFNNPSLKDTLTNSDDPEYKKKLISNIYNVEKQEDLEKILSKLLANEAEIIEEKVSICEAYTGKKYRYANINALLVVLAQQFSGISFVVLFLVFIFQSLNETGKLHINIPVALNIIQFINMMACGLGLIPIKYFGQRKTLVGG